MGNKRKGNPGGSVDPYHIWLAGLGAAARAEEEGPEQFVELAERGRMVVAASGKKARKAMQEIGESFQDWVHVAGKDVGAWFGRQVTGAARAAGLPNADSVLELSRRVDDLASRLERFERTQQQGSAAPPAERTEVHVLSASGAWQVQVSGDHAPLSSHPTKAPAVEAAQAVAEARQPSLLVVYTRTGAVQSRTEVG
jgi:hypothetical protein